MAALGPTPDALRSDEGCIRTRSVGTRKQSSYLTYDNDDRFRETAEDAQLLIPIRGKNVFNDGPQLDDPELSDFVLVSGKSEPTSRLSEAAHLDMPIFDNVACGPILRQRRTSDTDIANRVIGNIVCQEPPWRPRNKTRVGDNIHKSKIFCFALAPNVNFSPGAPGVDWASIVMDATVKPRKV